VVRTGMVAIMAAALSCFGAAQMAAPNGLVKIAANSPDVPRHDHVTLTVKVLFADIGGEPQPVDKAILRIQGSNFPSQTDTNGEVKLSGISKGKLKLQIMMIGADTCELLANITADHDQSLRVLIERAEDGKSNCRIQPR
jgi:hypothetical protein